MSEIGQKQSFEDVPKNVSEQADESQMERSVLASEAQSLIDLEVIQQLEARIGQAGIDELLDILFEETPQQLRRLLEAADREDRKTIHLLAHVMKSSSGTLGLKTLANQCKTLSDICHNMPLVEARFRAESIQDIYNKTATILQQKLYRKGREE